MKRIILLSTLLLLSGCESLHDFAVRHPVATGIGGALLIGSIAASVNHDGHTDLHDVQHPQDPCKANPQACH